MSEMNLTKPTNEGSKIMPTDHGINQNLISTGGENVTKEACMRLSATPTVNVEVRRSLLKHENVSCDSLDLVLSSSYNHHTQWWSSKAMTVSQGLDNSRNLCLRRQSQNGQIEETQESESLPVIFQEKYRNSMNHVAVNVSSNHLPTTQRGYGRKVN